MKAFFFSFSLSLLLIFCKASALSGVAPCEARLRGRRGAQRLHQGKAPAGSGRLGTPSVGRGRSLRAELASPGRRRLPRAVLVRGGAGCRIEGRRPTGGKGCWPRTDQTGVLAQGEGDWVPDWGLGVRGPEKIQAWQGLGGGVSEGPESVPESRMGNTGQARRVRPGFRQGEFRGRLGLREGSRAEAGALMRTWPRGISSCTGRGWWPGGR